jgi:hypothetical protein
MTKWRRIERQQPGPTMTRLIVVLAVTSLLCFAVAIVIALWD